MTWLVRMGALRTMANEAARDPSIRKADAPPRALTDEEIADNNDALMSSLGGTGRANMDFRSQALAKAEAAEEHQASVLAAAAERDGKLGKVPFVLPSEEQRRTKAANAQRRTPNMQTAETRAMTRAYYAHEDGEDDDEGSNTPPSASAPVTNPSVKPSKRAVNKQDQGLMDLTNPFLRRFAWNA